MPVPFLICVNLLPIGTYFCVLGLLHAAGRPLVTTGVRDFLALALALSGLAINGPFDSLLHSRLLEGIPVHSRWVGLGLYLVLVGVMVPRSQEMLVIYNSSESTVVAAVRGILERLGTRFQEVPGGWMLVERGVILEVDSFPALSNTTLCFRGSRDRELYRQIYRELPGVLAATRAPWSLVGFTMAAAGGLILALPIWTLAWDPRSLATLFRQMISTW